jgi:endonuclease YncB( thermonuclease family)
MAWHYKEYQHEQTTNDRLVYRDEEERAKARRVGLWKDAKPVPSWTTTAHRHSPASSGLRNAWSGPNSWATK